MALKQFEARTGQKEIYSGNSMEHSMVSILYISAFTSHRWCSNRISSLGNEAMVKGV